MSRKPQQIVVNVRNQFDVLASDSEDEGDVNGEDTNGEHECVDIHEIPSSNSKPSSPPFRVWSLDDAEKRFKNDTNIFSSPFSRKKGWAKPRFKEEDDGWVSIEVGQPSLEEAPTALESDLEGFSLTPQEFPSMLTRGDQEIAAIWAEKVKKNLDRVEKIRVEFKRGRDNSSDIGTRLSFFRGGIISGDK